MNYNQIGNNRYHRTNRRRKGLRKEQIIMLTASLFVLTALTMTGVYVNEKNKDDNDEYVVDLSAIEKKIPEKAEEIAEQQNQITAKGGTDDLDVDPAYQETNSDNVQSHIPGLEDTIQIPGVGLVTTDTRLSIEKEKMSESQETDLMNNHLENSLEETVIKEHANDSLKDTHTQYNFSEKGTLQWPIVGNVLINYSMDKTIYFPTLNQYKYNPAIVIEATEGEPVTAAAAGEVIAIENDAEIGNAVIMNIGNGYEVTYGQLEKVQVGAGQDIEEGALLGYVAKPTKYYSTEGCNVYFKLSKDGVAVNPMKQLH